MSTRLEWKFKYINHRGKIAGRRIYPDSVEFVRNPGFGYQPGWVISGYCLDKQARRSFMLSRILVDEPWGKEILLKFPVISAIPEAKDFQV